MKKGFKDPSNFLWYGAAFVVAAVITFAFGLADHIVMSKEPVDICAFEADWSKLEKNDHIKTDIFAVWDTLYSETTTESTYGIKTKEYESGRGYVIPHLYVDEDDYYNIDYYMILFVKNTAAYSKLEAVLDETDKWYNYEIDDLGRVTYEAEGKLEKISKEESEFMHEYLTACGYSAAEADKMILPYKLKISKDTFGPTLVIAGILSAIGITLIVIYIVMKKKEKEMEELMAMTAASATVSSTELEEDTLSESFMSGSAYNAETGKYENNSDNNY